MTIILANWKKLVFWAVLIFVVFQLVGIAVFVTYPNRLVGDIATHLSAFGLYFLFFRRTVSHQLLLGVALFLTIQLIDIVVVTALSGSAPDLDLPGTAISLSVCLLAYLVHRLSSNNSFKPKPLRGSA
jgi:hypothetical protein